MPPASGFTLNELKWSLVDPDNRREQALLDSLDNLIKKIDESKVLDEQSTQDDTIVAEYMPMSRTFAYVSSNVTPDQNALSAMKTILNAEQKLANKMLALAKEDLNSYPEDTANQKFRRQALLRIAIRQTLTESTDAVFRGLGYVASTRFEPRTETRLGGGRRAHPGQVARMMNGARMSLLEEICSISFGLSPREQKVLERVLRLEKQSLYKWLCLRLERQHVAFVAANLPYEVTLRTLKSRIQQKLKLYTRPKVPTPDWWPFPLEEVAQNIWGDSKI